MKKLLSIILVFGVLFTAFPLTAFAEENVAETEIQTAKDSLVEVGEATQVANGTCGDNLEWSLDSNGTLSITGTGDMYVDYSSAWDNSQYSIEKVEISNGVTSIYESAFFSCTNLKNVTIPDSVTSIGRDAFEFCTSLKSINVGENNPNYSSVDGILFNKNKTEFIKYPAGKTDESYTIPDSVTSISYSAFEECTSLTNVTIPNSVTSIDESAFEGCTSLTSITIPNSVTSIGESIFSGCTSLTSVTISDSVKYILDSAFYGCTSLTSVTIPNSVTSIDWYVFRGCTSLKSITIPDSVTNIDWFVFYGCTSLSDIYYSGSKQMWNNISIGAGNEELTNANIHFGKESPKTTITLPKTSATLFIGDRANINAVITNGYGATTYRSSNTRVAKVNSNGLVTAVGAGTAKITVTNNGVSKIFTVTVKKTTISLARYSANVYVKGSTVIKPTVRNGRGKTTFKSLNTKVARVYSNGKVTALKAGTAKIRVTNNKVSRIFTVKVLNPKLNKTSVAISRGKSFTLKITGRIGTAKFYTSNKKIATVNSKGKITVNKKAKKGQSAVITVKTNGVTLRCKVKVK